MQGEFCCGGTVESAYGQRVYVRPQPLRLPLVNRTNFACNSPQGISSFELEPLKFCCFRAAVHVASAGVACEIVEVVAWTGFVDRVL